MQRLSLFAKCPVAGRVKTRLCPPLTPAQAAALHTAFIEDQLRLLERFAGACRIELCLDGSWSPPVTIDGLRLSRQGPGDLGTRLERHFREGAASGLQSTVVVGADSPTLPAAHVQAALDTLAADAEAVVCPAEDGGYTLIGMAEPRPELLEGIPWGGPEVLRTTLRRAREAGVDLQLLDGWYDVDDAAGLERLARELRLPDGVQRAPSSVAALSRLDLGKGPML